MDSETNRLSPDEVVSYNLRQARELRGWTQQEAAEQISKHLGESWSVPVYSAAERAYRANRVKEFNATEVLAFCRAFRLPLAYFYLPPDPWTQIVPRKGGDEHAMTGDDLLGLIFPVDRDMVADLEARTRYLFTQFTAHVPRSENTAAYLGYVRRRDEALQAMAHGAFKDAGLEDAAAVLEDLAQRWRDALGMLTNDLQHTGIPEPSDTGTEDVDGDA